MASTDGRNVKLALRPGMDRRSTALGAEGGFYDGNHVRFRTGTPENMRGFEKAAGPFAGMTRAATHWSNPDATGQISFATNERIYIFANSSCYDITPVATSTSVNGIFNTVAGSNIVTASVSTHGANTSTGVLITNNLVTVGGNEFFSGSYVISSIVNANAFQFNAVTTATATSAGAGGAHFDIFLAAGPTQATGGFGWGADVWSHAAGWGAAASTTNLTLSPRQWSLDVWGTDLVASPRDGTLYFWDTSIGVSTRAYAVNGTPSRMTGIIVSPEDRHLIAYGVTDHFTSIFDPMLIRWTDTQSLQIWNPAVTNAAGGFRIGGGSRILGARRTRGATILWTDDAAHSMTFTGPPFTFSFRQLGLHCGLIGKNAGVDYNGRIFWMSTNNFHVFDGNVRPLLCPVYNKVFDDINADQSDKVYAGINEEFAEVIWLYPDSSSSEPNRYVIYKTDEDIWYFGKFAWTCWVEQSDTFTNCVTFGTDNYVRNHEPLGVFTSDGANMEAFIETADFDIGDGDHIAFIDRYIPDADWGVNGRAQMTMSAKAYPGAAYYSKGPFGVGPDTQKIDLRIRGRQFKVRYANPDDGALGQWRIGSPRLNVQPDGSR